MFTAEVIGVVWREPDPGPAQAKEMCACAVLRVCVYTLVYMRLFVMTDSEAREGKQALASVSPLGNR